MDSDCDGALGPEEIDDDGDGMDECEGDCDDGDPDVRPGLPEACNGQDDNCDGQLPQNESDVDGDGYMACGGGPDGGDCNDNAADVYPGAPELCNGLDDDCDGALGADELDDDGDNWLVCEGDCDDGDFTVHPAMNEQCSDGVDNDCDGLVDLDDGDCSGWIDPNLVCGPTADLEAGSPPFSVITGRSDVEVMGLAPDGWTWFGCQARVFVTQLGTLDCGSMYEVEGWSTAIDLAASSYVIELDLYPVYDTCGTAVVDWIRYRIRDVSGGSWDLYEVSLYDPATQSYTVMDPDAAGEMIWAPNGTEGWGWIEYASGALP